MAGASQAKCKEGVQVKKNNKANQPKQAIKRPYKLNIPVHSTQTFIHLGKYQLRQYQLSDSTSPNINAFYKSSLSLHY